ncbi:papilin-like [Amblyomma americanum]
MKCLSVRAEEHSVCNTGPNRFATEEDCLRECVRPQRKDNKCSISRELAPCEENHINVTWWFYDFGLYACTQWTYDTGKCPAIHSGVNYFTTQKDCIAACTPRGLKKPAPCYAPTFGYTCPASVMKEPYFAHQYADGTWRCHKADISTIREHRCIEEKWRFDTEEDCKATCVGNPRQELQALPPSLQPMESALSGAERGLNVIEAGPKQ